MCQEKTNKKLVDPYGAVYVTLPTNIPEPYILNATPIQFDLKSLKEGDGILKTLEENKAKYY